MGVIWDLGRARVRDVQQALAPERPLAYTTVMTVLNRLVDKGYLRREKEGRSYVYSARSNRQRVAGGLLRSLIDRLYDGAVDQAIAHLLTEEDIDEEELARLEALIRARRERKGG